jgi:putative oxidoreductase
MQTVMTSKAGKQTHTGRSARALNIALWVLQVLLAAVFLAHGYFMVAPPAEMVELINAQLGAEFRVFIGVAELLAGIGLIAPGVSGILPFLTTWAAGGLMIVMSSATGLHLVRGEFSSAIFSAVLLALITVVAYTRWKVQPLKARRRA